MPDWRSTRAIRATSDYRDELQMIIEQKFPSRYAFCQTIGLDEGYLLARAQQAAEYFDEKTGTNSRCHRVRGDHSGENQAYR